MTFAEASAGAGVVRPDASIVIPVHNKSTITRTCLDALLAEADDGLAREIIVVDDGSTDLTPSLLASYGNRIRVLRHESAQGFARACNAGFAASTGEFVVLLNNDTIPTTGWLAALVAHARANPAAAVVGAKLLFPNDTIQHAGVVFGLDSLPHHIYAGFPADHPAASVSRRFRVVTAACSLFRRGPWDELGGLDTSYRNGWEDVDYCLRAGQAGYEVHYCAESVIYHLESATRDLFAPVELANRELFVSRWKHAITPDDIGYYWFDGLLSATYGARYPFKIEVSPLLAGVTVGEQDRLADRMLFDRSRQVMILLRNNIVLNVRVQEAEARAAEAEHRLAIAEARLAAIEGTEASDNHPPASPSVEHHNETAQDGAETLETATEPSPTPLPHRIVGMVESPGRLPDVITDGVLVVSGWTLTDSGEARIEVIVNGETRGEIPYGDPRADAAALYPGFPAGDLCGFAGEIAVGDLPDGMHEVTIRIHATPESHATLSTTFEIDNHAFETGRVIGRFDQPVRGAIFLAREIAPVSGWVLAPSGIRSLEVTVDGEARGRVDYGALRPDIAKRRRQYPDADHCGFSGSVPLFGLPAGSHELAVSIAANDGRQLELSTRIEIEAVESIDAGLPVINRHYPAWLEQRGAKASANGAPLLPEPLPAFELIVPISGDCEEALAVLAQSVFAQTYPAWRLTLAADDSGEAALALARELAATHERVAYRPPSPDSAVALNEALAASSAAWVAIVHPGALLAPDALTTIASAIAAAPAADLAYVDDDRVDPALAVRWNPFFKPDWSPDLLLAMNYLGPLVVFRREAAVAAGGMRPEFAGAEVYDLALRVSERSGEILHVAEVLATRIEAAPAPEQPWHAANWNPSEQRAIADALTRRGVAATVEPGLHPGLWRVRYALDALPAVTAVIPTGGKLHLLHPCLRDLLERTDYPNLEVLLVDNSGGDAVADLVAELTPRHPNIHIRRIVDDRKPFNFPALINNAVAQATTPYVLMLNDDITVIDPGWLRAMMEHAQRPEVGVVGAKLLYPDDTIQHAGVVLGPFGGSVHVFKRLPGNDPGYFDLPDVVRNCSAVTFACALIDRALFTELGGMDAENFPVAFNDVDFCLRAREAGYEVIYTPHATLYHHESVTKTVIAHPHEIGYLRSRWGHVIDHDPYYNPNLTRSGEDARLNMTVVPIHAA